MGNELNQKKAEQTYRLFCNALDNNDWSYRSDDQKLRIECGAKGEDLPIELNIHFDVEKQLIMILSKLPFDIAEDKRVDAVVAICAINNALVDGCFDYDVNTGTVFFRITNSFLDSFMSKEVCMTLLYKACKMVDDYNDKLLMLSKGMLTIEQFLKLITD